MSTSMNDLLYPKASPALLAQMQQDRQNELKARAEFEAEKARLAKANLLQHSKPQSNDANNSTEPHSDDKKELEEMTIAEIGCEVPKVKISVTSLADLFKGAMKINQTVRRPYDTDITLLLGVVSALVSAKGSTFDELHHFALKLIQTAGNPLKKGYDINASATTLYRIPLTFLLDSFDTDKSEISEFHFIIEALILAGAKFDTFDLSRVPQNNKTKAPFDLSVNASEVTDFFTPLDAMMCFWQRSERKKLIDFYSLSEWNPSLDIPSTLEEPTYRLILKTIYGQAGLVIDYPEITIEGLMKIFARPKQQASNFFPTPINTLIFSYAKPKIEDVRNLSCFKRNRAFYQNILYIGRQFCIEDQEKEAELLAKELQAQPAKVRI